MNMQGNWRWCSKCAEIFSEGSPTARTCPADYGAHDSSVSLPYALPLGDGGAGQQGGWRWCKKCHALFYGGGGTQGVCPVDYLPHDGSNSLRYATMMGEGALGQQSGWRWCKNCLSMFYGGGSNQGVCPVPGHPGRQSGWRWCRLCQAMFFLGNAPDFAGVCPKTEQFPHDAEGSAIYSVVQGESGPGQQGGWRWCKKCQGLFFAAGANNGVCPKDHQPHDGTASAHYAVVPGSETRPGQQAGWRWCRKCQGLFFADNPSGQVCPADQGLHDGSQSLAYVALTGDNPRPHDGSASAHYEMPFNQFMVGFEYFKVENCRSKGDHNDVDTLIVAVSNDKIVQTQKVLLGDNLHMGDEVHNQFAGPFFLDGNANVTVTFTVLNSADGNVVENTIAKIAGALGAVLDVAEFADTTHAFNLRPSMLEEVILGGTGLVFDVLGLVLGHSNPDCSGAVLVRSFTFNPHQEITFPAGQVEETQSSPEECGNQPHSLVTYSARRL